MVRRRRGTRLRRLVKARGDPDKAAGQDVVEAWKTMARPRSNGALDGHRSLCGGNFAGDPGIEQDLPPADPGDGSIPAACCPLSPL